MPPNTPGMRRFLHRTSPSHADIADNRKAPEILGYPIQYSLALHSCHEEPETTGDLYDIHQKLIRQMSKQDCGTHPAFPTWHNKKTIELSAQFSQTLINFSEEQPYQRHSSLPRTLDMTEYDAETSEPCASLDTLHSDGRFRQPFPLNAPNINAMRKDKPAMLASQQILPTWTA